jgi:hypothetical protein
LVFVVVEGRSRDGRREELGLGIEGDVIRWMGTAGDSALGEVIVAIK